MQQKYNWTIPANSRCVKNFLKNAIKPAKITEKPLVTAMHMKCTFNYTTALYGFAPDETHIAKQAAGAKCKDTALFHRFTGNANCGATHSHLRQRQTYITYTTQGPKAHCNHHDIAKYA